MHYHELKRYGHDDLQGITSKPPALLNHSVQVNGRYFDFKHYQSCLDYV